MSNAEDRLIREHISRLRQEHRELDGAIARLEAEGLAQQLQVSRLKKQKLRLKDEIQALESKLLPDIIA